MDLIEGRGEGKKKEEARNRERNIHIKSRTLNHLRRRKGVFLLGDTGGEEGKNGEGISPESPTFSSTCFYKHVVPRKTSKKSNDVLCG